MFSSHPALQIPKSPLPKAVETMPLVCPIWRLRRNVTNKININIIHININHINMNNININLIDINNIDINNVNITLYIAVVTNYSILFKHVCFLLSHMLGGPPPCNRGIFGMYKDPNVITILPSVPYYLLGGSPKHYSCLGHPSTPKPYTLNPRENLRAGSLTAVELSRHHGPCLGVLP